MYEDLINESLSDFVRSIDKLRHIVRYQTAPRCSSESVAEHSFFVAVYVLKLYKYYKFDLQKALSLALLHDYSEVFISDVPHPIKAQNPDLKDALEAAEDKVARSHLSDTVAQWLQEFNHATSVEGKVCALADVISVVTYAKFETDLGNKDYMAQVFNGVMSRYVDCINVLSADLREGVSSKDVLEHINMIASKQVENI